MGYVSFNAGPLYAINASETSWNPLWNYTFQRDDYEVEGAVLNGMVASSDGTSVFLTETCKGFDDYCWGREMLQYHGKVYAIDARTGEPRWNASWDWNPTWSPPVVHEGTLYVGSDRGYYVPSREQGQTTGGAVFAFVESTGALRWQHNTTSPVWSVAVLPQVGLVVAGCDDGTLHGLKLETGTQKWSLDVYGKLHRDDFWWKNVLRIAAGSGGMFYVASPTGGVYGFDATCTSSGDDVVV
eukprot:NODE_3528_length_773_cov_375.316156.p1 GENE.NODE_3528_length_773_cov_375.316156~~NODE_3528_length_773_cov_375.316156.p1  ORF type:complete len:241 (+),score=50.04 NODE_3528_length_773_cov_375.316156:3-725(+)